MIRISRHFAAALVAAVMFTGQAAAGTVEGRFCGPMAAWFGLIENDTFTELRLRPDGRLAGYYIIGGWLGGFGGIQGRLAEAEPGSGPVRQLAWSDRRGGGKLVITFNATMTAFRGFWGTGTAEPKARWDGERCASL